MRLLQFFPWLRDAGIACLVQPLLSDELLQGRYDAGRYSFDKGLLAYGLRVLQLLQRRQFDLIWIEKEALPWLPAWFELALLRGVPYVLDYDDALFHNYDLHSNRLVRRFMGRRIDHMMAGACLVVCGNEYLAQRARDAGASWVEVVPTVIDLKRYSAKSQAVLQADLLRIVWIGSPSTVQYLAALNAPLAALARLIPFKLRVIGGTLAMHGVDVECVRWTEDTEVTSISQCDVGIMPLSDSPWERGKCGYKLIQYMACGLPVVASPIGVNRQIIDEGVNGFFAEGEEAWVSKLALLLADTALCQKLGQAGRRRVEEEYCLQKVGPQLVKLLLNAGNTKKCAD
jgi:glycosyltransferase involved in cell wall biosynthesis